MAKGLPKGISQRADGRYMARFQYRGEKYCIYDYNIENLKDRITDLKYEVRHGIYAKEGNITADEWFKVWLGEYKSKTVKEATLLRYESVYNKHMKSVFGDKKLRDIKPDAIQKFYNSLEGTENVIIAATILSGMFSQAYKNQIINRNPIPLTTVPKAKEKKERRVLTLAEQELLLNHSNGTLRDLIEVSLSTGMRTGEIRALEWKDLDFENKTIHITGTLTELGGKMFKDTPKTKSSLRDIPMLGNVEKIFLRIRREQKDKSEKLGPKYEGREGLEDLVFRSGRGTPVSNSCYVRMLNRAVARIKDKGIEFEHVHPHTLRHTFATRCIENGVPPQVLKTLLGHSTLAMTMDLYAHVLPDTKAEELQKIAGLF